MSSTSTNSPRHAVSCDATWCTHEISTDKRPATIPPPRRTTSKPGDLALHQPTAASSHKEVSTQASQAVDWTAYGSAWRAFGDNQWWRVKLAKRAVVNKVVIDWDHTDVPTDFRIQASTDGSRWTTLGTYPKPSGGSKTYAVHSGTPITFVRLSMGKAATGYGIGVWDVQVFGVAPAATPSAGPSPTVGPTLPATPEPTGPPPTPAEQVTRFNPRGGPGEGLTTVIVLFAVMVAFGLVCLWALREIRASVPPGRGRRPAHRRGRSGTRE